MRILVTGGFGFLGSDFVRLLVGSSEDEVSVLDSLTTANSSTLDDLHGSRLRRVVGSVCDAALVEELVAAQDAVVHFAAHTHNDHSLRDPEPFVQTNLVGTFTVLEAVRRHGVRYHHVSTDEVFGDLDLDDPGSFTEASPYRPSSPYSATKAGSDLLVRAWVRSFGVAATISNSCNVYGPFQHVEKFIPRQVTEVLDGRRPKLYGDGRQVRDWVHVRDHSAAVDAILRGGIPGRSYLIGAGQERDNRSVVRTILALMGREPDDYDLVADRPGHDQRYSLDSTRLRSELGWRPTHDDFEDGLATTIRWYRDNDWWWRPGKAAVEERYASR